MRRVSEHGPVRVAVFGGGWRAEYFLRVARQLPDEFAITSVWARDPARGAALGQRFGVAATSIAEEAASIGSPEFALVCLPSNVAPGIVDRLAQSGVAALTETPPASSEPDIALLARLAESGAVIEVAEHYQYQPMHAARLELIRQGVIGQPSLAEVSVAHGYHGVSLLRRYLGIRRDDAVDVDARRYPSTVLKGGSRNTAPTSQLVGSQRTVAQVRSGERLGLYVFDDDQYFSLVRPPRTIVEGSRGTIVNSLVTSVGADGRQRSSSLVVERTGGEGDLRGNAIEQISFEGRSLFVNPWPGVALSEEEIALATVLSRMGASVRGNGPGPYALLEGIADWRISERIDADARAQPTQTTMPVR